MTIEEGGFGAESAAPAALQILEAYFHKQREPKSRPPNGRKPPNDVRDPHQTRRGPSRSRSAPALGERLGLAHMDWPLTFAAVALVAFSVFTLGQATTHDVPGSPNYYVDRQAIYGVLGVVGMLLLTRIDYSRFRELRVGIYTFLCASVALVFVFGFAARGSRRSFELPFFSFQPSELGKLLLVLALAGFVIDGARRRLGEAAHGALSLPRDWPRRRSFSCSRTSAPRWCSWSRPSP